MARINIEECWWSDPRRTKLLLRVGFAADAAAVNMWRVAQEFWGKGRSLLPKAVFDNLEFAPYLIECGLADVRESFVYVRGSSEWLEWHAEKREQATAAGLKSAEVRRKKYGSAQPKPAKMPKNSERAPNDPRTNGNDAEPSLSGSLSGSKKEEYIHTEAEFEEVAKEYCKTFPGTTVGSKAKDRFFEQIKSPIDLSNLWIAIVNYKANLDFANKDRDWKSAKVSFENFLGTKRSGFYWREFIAGSNVPALKLASSECGFSDV